jgi:hypothetical protein
MHMRNMHSLHAPPNQHPRHNLRRGNTPMRPRMTRSLHARHRVASIEIPHSVPNSRITVYALARGWLMWIEDIHIPHRHLISQNKILDRCAYAGI